ncbi:Hypothetical protein ADU72_2026 [Pediococcus damnosus]|uniref:Uncharacterized protein n=2 Tax=Pediococcus damnosus TaxID=51663 RepID=A0A0R2HHH9_9LACO|nr:hypothetical protein [Pediococcus damnosus]AMV61443.1 Hypothetical protein ADU69_1796 [Pediococcus damnosus]AMV62195.1 Hypothetical protein ADU70_0697 [Pediococcus damnosus]AMV65806.1 Hypothetical protein ADU71_1920 [Pediococcus damnosus]AMV67947.1 Hypothetical protein ADU72_2026 [Pediococcus damnosus]AMV70143.1 Hypothetical protein ADU73_1755 [Pediococcus damnosus]
MKQKNSSFIIKPEAFYPKLESKSELSVAMHKTIQDSFKADPVSDLVSDHSVLKGHREIMRLIETDFPNLTKSQWQQAYQFLQHKHSYFDAEFILQSVTLYLIVKWATTQKLTELEQQFIAAVTVDGQSELYIKTNNEKVADEVKQINTNLQKNQEQNQQEQNSANKDNFGKYLDIWSANNDKALNDLETLIKRQELDWWIVNWNPSVIHQYWLKLEKSNLSKLDVLSDPSFFSLNNQHPELANKCYQDSFLATGPVGEKVDFSDITAITDDNPLAFYLLSKLATQSTTVSLLIINQLQGYTHGNRYWLNVDRYSPKVRKTALSIEKALLPLESSPRLTSWQLFRLFAEDLGWFWD